jgi:hypothetical protein
MAAGTAAATQTTTRSATSRSQTAWKQNAASVSLSRESRSASMPRVVAGAASGTTKRLATTPMSESWLKKATMIGVTASWAPTLTANDRASHTGHPHVDSHSASGGPR